MPVGEQALAHRLRVGVRDLAAEEADREASPSAADLYCVRSSRSAAQPSSLAARPRADSRATSGSSRAEVAGGDDARRSSRAATAPSTLERDVRDDDVRRRQLVRERVGESSVDLDAVRRGVARSVASTAAGSSSTAITGPKPSFAAAIESTPEPQPTSSRLARLELQQQLEAEARRRVRAGAERAARVDDDRDRAGRRLLPRRPDPERADPDRPVELAPAILPARLDLLERARRRTPARAAPRRPRRCTRRARRRRRASTLLEALREELEQRARASSASAAATVTETAQAQRNALFSLSKNPSSALVRRRPARAVELLEQLPLLVGEPARARPR